MNKQIKRGFLFSSLIIGLSSFSGLMVVDLKNDQIQKTEVIKNNWFGEKPDRIMTFAIVDGARFQKDFPTGTEQEKADKFNALPFKERVKYIRCSGVDPAVVRSDIMIHTFNYSSKANRELNWLPAPWTNDEFGFNIYPSHPGDGNITEFPVINNYRYQTAGLAFYEVDAPAPTVFKSKLDRLDPNINKSTIRVDQATEVEKLIRAEVDNWNKRHPVDDADYNKRFPMLSKLLKFDIKHFLKKSELLIKRIEVDKNNAMFVELTLWNYINQWNGSELIKPTINTTSVVKLSENPYLSYDWKNNIDLSNDGISVDNFKRNLEAEISKFNSVMENNKSSDQLPTFNGRDFPIFKKMNFEIKNFNTTTRIDNLVNYKFDEITGVLKAEIKFYSTSDWEGISANAPISTLHSQVSFFKEPKEPPVPPTEGNTKESLSIGAISGISVGVIVFIAACAVGGFFLIKMLKSKKDNN